MQWSQIKILFILCFLVLDVYLLIQFVDRQKENDIDVYEQQESTIEEQLDLEDITIPKKLPKNEEEQSYISVKQKSFSQNDLDALEKFKNQKSALLGKNTIVSAFDEPIKVKDDDDIEQLVQNNIIYPDHYTFWRWDKDLNVLIFCQVEDGQPVFLNRNGLLLVFLNDKNEMDFYAQTLLTHNENDYDKREKPLIKPLRAIYTIYNHNELFHGEKVTSASLGFYTALPITGDVQTFAPTWKITVENKRDYYVNAIEGVVYTSSEKTLLNDCMTDMENALGILKDNSKLEGRLMNGLKKRIDAINRSEEK